MSEKDKKDDLVEKLTETQQDVLDSLQQSFERYNSLVERLIEVATRDYDSVYDLKKAILESLSKSLHKG